VLEEVGEPRPIPRLDPEADVVVDGDGDDGSGRVGRQNDLEPVVELPIVDRDVERTVLRGRGAGEGEDERRPQAKNACHRVPPS
jgi:hypothetical protein